MDYIFGNKNDIEVLKTKGAFHTDLTGYHSVKRENDVEVIVDSFRVIRKYNSSKDAEGNCYDWYEIDKHYRVQDKTLRIVNQANKDRECAENALCELDEDIHGRISAIEDAICDLDEQINGGD